MARPTKRTPKVERAIIRALRRGLTRTAAAESNGIPRETLSRWMARFVTFRHAVLQAEARAEVRATVTITEAIDGGDAKMALAWLERRRPADWSPRAQVSVEIRLLAEQIAARTGADPDWLVKRASEIANGANT